MDYKVLTEEDIRDGIQGCFESTNVEIVRVDLPKREDSPVYTVALKGDLYLTELTNIGKLYNDDGMLIGTDYIENGCLCIYFVPREG